MSGLPAWIEARILVEDTGCWRWVGTIGMNGYGRFNTGKRLSYMAHRAVYQTLVGPVPEGLELDHLCRNPPCVNPAHLEPVTHAENMRRSPLTGRAHALKTHCKHGHPRTPENTYVSRNNGKACKVCKIERQRLRRAGRAA